MNDARGDGQDASRKISGVRPGQAFLDASEKALSKFD